MYIKLILLFIINHLNIISSEEIAVLFNNTFILDNSIITWVNYTETNNTSCLPKTTIETEQEQSSTLMTEIQTSISTTVQSVIVYSCSDGSYGVNCNISSNICDISNPCLNGATCYSNNNLSAGYMCQCATGFSDYDCGYDERICGENTCWNNGTCVEMNTTVSGNNITSFLCQCIYGYDGTNCELEYDMCANITCENRGICISSYLKWSCQCIDSSLYSGTYCEEKSSTLTTKEAISKSFAIIAIVALSCVVAFVIIMDILKYIFKIDPVDRERHRLKMEKEKEEQMKFTKKKLKKKKKKKKMLIARFSVI